MKLPEGGSSNEGSKFEQRFGQEGSLRSGGSDSSLAKVQGAPFWRRPYALPACWLITLMCDEPEGFRTFRLGLFGLDKLHNVDRSVATLDEALSQVL